MRSSEVLIQSRAFTDSLDPYMEEARAMYPGGRFQKFLRGFHRIFRPGLVEFTDGYHAMVLLDREQRTEVGVARGITPSPAHIEPNPFELDYSNVLPAGGLIDTE